MGKVFGYVMDINYTAEYEFFEKSFKILKYLLVNEQIIEWLINICYLM